MKFFCIEKWGKFQHYDKPRPPWIKIYTSINDSDTDWRPLLDHELGQLMRLSAYAALHENTLPFNAEYLEEDLEFDQSLDLDRFAKLGIIKVFPNKSSCLSREKSRVSSRKSTKKKKAPLVQSSEFRDKSLENREQSNTSANSAELVAAEIPEPKVFGPEVMRLGNLLAQRMIDNDPKAKIPTTEKQKANWLDSIEKINRLDGREWLEIEQVINWCQDDGFWKGNILSASKLRKQFPQLLAKMKSNGGKKLSGADQIARNKRVLEELNNELEI